MTTKRFNENNKDVSHEAFDNPELQGLNNVFTLNKKALKQTCKAEDDHFQQGLLISVKLNTVFNREPNNARLNADLTNYTKHVHLLLAIYDALLNSNRVAVYALLRPLLEGVLTVRHFQQSDLQVVEAWLDKGKHPKLKDILKSVFDQKPKLQSEYQNFYNVLSGGTHPRKEGIDLFKIEENGKKIFKPLPYYDPDLLRSDFFECLFILGLQIKAQVNTVKQQNIQLPLDFAKEVDDFNLKHQKYLASKID